MISRTPSVPTKNHTRKALQGRKNTLRPLPSSTRSGGFKPDQSAEIAPMTPEMTADHAEKIRMPG